MSAAPAAIAGWSDGYPIVPETDAAVSACLEQAGLARDAQIASGVAAREVAVQTIRAGGRPEYMPVVVAALEAVLDPAFHAAHLGGPLSSWPAFVVNGPITEKIGLYSGIYVMASARRANATIGRAISLVLGSCLPQLGSRDTAILGNAARMAGMVIAEKQDTSWEPLHVSLGQPREASTVTAFSTSQGSPLQVLPLGTRYMSAPPIAALVAEHFAEGWCGPGTTLLLVSPNAQRVFLADRWSKDDLRDYLKQHARISVAQLKRLRRWKPASGERATDSLSAPLQPGDEQRWLRLADKALWEKLYPAPGQREPVEAEFDVLPVVAGSEVAHMYMYLFYPYPAPLIRPVTKRIRQP
jgi:hypothetical protein